jgi:hypothetical protein
MSYNEVFDLHLTPLYAGKKLSGQLYNSNNTTNGSVITSGFVELSNGDYTLNTSIPDQFQGWINIYVSGVGYVADTSVNNGLPVNNGFWSGVAVPAVTWSNLDVPVSTRLATSGYTAPTNIISTADYQKLAKLNYKCGGTVWFVTPNGASGNDGLSWATAKSQLDVVASGAAYGDIVIFDGSNSPVHSVRPTSGIKLLGTGINSAFINVAGNSNSGDGVGLVPCTNGYYANFTITGNPTVGVYTAPISTSNTFNGGGGVATNFEFNHVQTTGYSDGLHVVYGTGIFTNCNINTGYDAIAGISSNDGGVIEFNGCSIVVNSIVPNPAFTCRGFGNNQGNILIDNCYVECNGSGILFGVQDNGNITTINNSTFYINGSGWNLAQNTGQILVNNCSYDPTRTSGTITIAPPLGTLATTTQLNSGVSAIETQISGVVLDFSGIATTAQLNSGVAAIETQISGIPIVTGYATTVQLNSGVSSIENQISGITEPSGFATSAQIAALSQQLQGKAPKSW